MILVDDLAEHGVHRRSGPGLPPRPRSGRRVSSPPRGPGIAAPWSPPPPRVPQSFRKSEGTRREELSGDTLSLPRPRPTPPGRPCSKGWTGCSRPCTYPTRQLTIVTDLRKAGWEAGVSPIASAGMNRGRVRIVDVGADEVANVALESLVPLDRTILAGARRVAGRP